MSKIPEGATHKNAFGFFCKYHAGVWYSYADGDWIRFIDAETETYIPILADPEWTGEGLPPVGMVCEYQTWTNREWRKTKILAHHLGFAVHSWSVDGDDMEVDAAPAQDFRTIRTPEQIAAENRDAAIKEMQRIAGSINTFPFAELYDYGYRLQVAE